MMGSDEDPENNKAVAFSLFIAVAVYGVCQTSHSTLAEYTDHGIRDFWYFVGSRRGCM